MPRPCSACSHEHRTDLDRRLLAPGANVSALAREYGMSRVSLKRHEAHVADLVRRFHDEDLEYSAGSLRAEHRKLYERTLRALDQAESGVLSHVGKDGEAHYKVSQSAIAAFIREARAGLDSMAKVGARETETVEVVVNRALDDRIVAALERNRARREGRGVEEGNPLPLLELEGEEPSTSA